MADDFEEVFERDDPRLPGPSARDLLIGTYYARDAEAAGDVLFHCGVIGAYYFGWEFDPPLLRFGNPKADAVLFQEDYEDYVLIKVRNAPKNKKIWTIPEYFAAYKSRGKIRHLSKVSQMLWWMRAMLETRKILDLDLPAMRIRPIPPDARESVVKIYDGFVKLVKLRLLYDRRQKDFPYSYDFIRAWSDIGSDTTVRKGLLWLKDNGYIRETRREEIEPRHIAIFYTFAFPNIKQLIKKQDILGLVEALDDPDDRIREQVSKELMNIGQPAVNPLLEALQSAVIGSEASRLLAKIGEPAFEGLIKALEGTNPTARENAIFALGLQKSNNAIKPLVRMLQDENVEEEIRVSIAEQLYFHASEDQLESVKDIIDSLIDDEW